MSKPLTAATIAFVLAVATSLSRAQSSRAQSPHSTDREWVSSEQAASFTAVPRPKAVEAARELAARDFATGQLRILIISKRIWGPSYEDYLRDHYGVRIMFLSMPQPEKALSVEIAYNKTMHSLLEKKFQKDIFKEAKVATGQKW